MFPDLSDLPLLIAMFIAVAMISGCGEDNPLYPDNGAEWCNQYDRGGVAYVEYGIVYCNNGQYFDGNA